MSEPTASACDLTRASAGVLREGELALRALDVAQRRVQAWDLLQERDGDGNALGPLPYTDAAIRAFEALHTEDPLDADLVHHLAVAHHARAWDLELQGSQAAFGAWERALGFWRELSGMPEFWSALRERMQRCRADADPGVVESMRRSLMEELLDVHVAFIRHYGEQGKHERAVAHVSLVRRARLPPKASKALLSKVFEAMTETVPAAVAQKDYEAALGAVERFLALCSDQPFVPALILHGDVSNAWVDTLSARTHWDEIEALSRRALPVAETLVAVLAHDDAPRARSVLEQLAFRVALRGHDRISALGAGTRGQDGDEAGRLRLMEAHEIPAAWGRLVFPVSRAGTRIRGLHARVLQSWACAFRALSVSLWNEAGESDDPMGQQARAIALGRESVRLIEEAQGCAPDDGDLATDAARFREEVDRLDS